MNQGLSISIERSLGVIPIRSSAWRPIHSWMAALRVYGPLLPFSIWLGFRATAPSRLAAVETAVGTLLLLGAIAFISTAPREGTGKTRLLPMVVASAFLLFSLVASGDLALTPESITRPTGIYANGWSLLSPALNGIIGHRLFFYLPLLSLVALTIIGSLLGAAVSLMNSARSRSRDAIRGVGGVLPATVAAPAACGPSLVAGLGAGTAGLLGAAAPPLLALSALLLAAQIWRLRRALKG